MISKCFTIKPIFPRRQVIPLRIIHLLSYELEDDAGSISPPAC